METHTSKYECLFRYYTIKSLSVKYSIPKYQMRQNEKKPYFRLHLIQNMVILNRSNWKRGIGSTGSEAEMGMTYETSVINGLFVMDGWYPYGRFMKFIYYPVVEGLKVWVGETAQ